MTAADTVKDLDVDVKRCPACGTGFGAEAAFCPFDGIALEASTWDPSRDPMTGTVVDNRYEVIAPLGEGGMGTVYKVRHVTLDRMFAMKVLRRDLAADRGLSARFLQEARATAAIRHPAVVAISDFGSLEDGTPYFVMDLLVGETLATRLRSRGLLSPGEAASIARKLADALGAAHAANVVHRDLKPENVFLIRGGSGKPGSDEEVRIVDFGAAKIVGGSKLTRPGVVFGTPYYMSPEQAGGHAVDARADVYSLGVLLYEMITGAVPFEADTYMGVLTKHLFAAPTKPSERAPSGLQLGDLEAVVMRALEKDPGERYPSMAEVAAAIERATEGKAALEVPREEARPVRTVPFVVMSSADKIQRSVERQVLEDERRKRRTRLAIAGCALATVAVGATAIALLETTESKRTQPQVAASASAPAAVAVAVAVDVSAPAASSAPPVTARLPVTPGPPGTTTGRTSGGSSVRPKPPSADASPAVRGSARPPTDPFAGIPGAQPAPPPQVPSDPLDPWRH